MKKERTQTVNSGDDLEIMSEIIKNDPWLLEQVISKIRDVRAASRRTSAAKTGDKKDDGKKN